MGESFTHSILVKGSIQDVFRAWTSFEDYPTFMQDVESVSRMRDGDGTFRWRMQGPMGKELEWTTQITRWEENQRLAWKTLEGDIQTSGQVTFAELPDGYTQVTLMYHYEPPAGALGNLGAKLFGDPEKRVLEDLRSFKNYFEGMPDRLPSDD
jgi:uncharacterized membrane protein